MTTTKTITPEEEVWDALREVDDPEIPGLSVVDLGIIRSVKSSEVGIEVQYMPTFTGCPAIDAIREMIEARLRPLSEHVSVRVTWEEAWTSDRISEKGRERLRIGGFAPPPREGLIGLRRATKCPYCGSHDTQMDNAFGPTLCRSIHYCNACRQPFEGFKPL